MKLFFTSLLLSMSLLLTAQSIHQNYSRAKIDLTDRDIRELGQVGVEVDHGQYAPGRFFINDFSDYELEQIEAAGFEVEILIKDVEAYYTSPERRAETIEKRNDNCDEDGDGFTYTIPENFSLGTMSGFYTYQEMLDNLDAMAAQYPELISQRAPVDGITTIEGRPIYWLRLSDNPNTDETDEPEVFYNALHHAREPNSMTQLIFYMWYLLENYATDPEVQFLVDNTEMYFMPCVNPDGYLYNEETNPDGGGLWRKNRRLNADGSYGVDLNRNYGYEWGHDNSGSSPDPNSQVYRGTGGFSEPETQAVRQFCNDHNFQIALNYHTYGNLLIYPWGYSDSPTPEADIFNGFTDIMTMENNYLAGTGSETVGYVVNGGSDDWMYGENQTKDRIFAMTPEVGGGGSNGGFWPVIEDIIPNCQATMWMNLATANLVHNYGLVEDDSPNVLSNLQGAFFYSLTRLGLKDGDLTVAISPISDNIVSIGLADTYQLDQNETAQGSIDFELDPSTQLGEEVVYQLTVNNGVFTRVDTITKRYGLPEDVFEDAADDLSNWTVNSGTWAVTTTDFYSAPSSITDSPVGFYESNTYSQLALNEYLPITSSVDVKLYFYAKWDIEADYDYVQLQLTVNQQEPIPLCGRYTTTGTEFQDEGNPVWDGNQSDWVEEAIDLTPYLMAGDSISLSFVLISDGFIEGDGYYFDDLKLVQLNEEVVNNIDDLEAASFMLSQNRPNPATTFTNIDLQLDGVDFEHGRLQVLNMLGQLVWEERVTAGGLETVALNTSRWMPGVYTYRLLLDGEVVGVRRMEVVR